MTPWTAAHQASLSFTISQRLLKLMPTELVMASNHLILCHSLLLLNSILPSVKLFTLNGQSIGASALASVLPMNIQDWFPLELTGLIFLLSKGLSRVFSSTTVYKNQFFGTQPFLIVQLSHPYMTTGKTIALTLQTFLGEWCLCFLICSLGLS